MAIRFQCGCGKSFQVKDSLAGKSSKCPKCGQPLVIPQLDRPAASGIRPPPVVFVSSTEADLKEYRKEVSQAAMSEGLMPTMMEIWVAKDARPPLAECLHKITGGGAEKLPPSNVVVVVIAQRYGWVPEDQKAGNDYSITWIECLKAKEMGLEILAFVLDDEKGDWPDELKEDYRVMQAVREKKSPEEMTSIYQDVQFKQQKLDEFKQWLMPQRICNKFTSQEDLYNKVRAALADWKQRHPEFRSTTLEDRPDATDPTRYLQLMLEECAGIDIRGLQVASGRAKHFPIDELYIPLTMAGRGDERGDAGKLEEFEASQAGSPRHDKRIELDEALRHQRLVIIGDPGAGKTTFLRRIVFLLCRTLLGADPKAAKERLGLDGQPFPLLVRVGELCQHIVKRRERKDGPFADDAPEWLVDFLATASKEYKWGLGEAFFQQTLADGEAMLLLDGLDEAPTDALRRQISAMVQKATAVYPELRLAVTSRPGAYEGQVVLPSFTQAQIEHLEDEAVANFLRRWCEALFPESHERAERHHDELLYALHSRVEIRRIARNPVMLTALAVVHWNEKRIPDQRADLYESIIKWLSVSREREGRQPAEHCVNLLQDLALYMQDHKSGRQVQIPRREAAEAMAGSFREGEEHERIARADHFLRQEELDSGIIVGRGDHVRFWHLTFQEFMAARALAARNDQFQSVTLFSQAKLYEAEWRETVLLLAGVLYHNGIQKVDRMFAEILDTLVAVGSGKKIKLADAASCAGLLGAAVQDLSPVGYQPQDRRYKKLFDQVMGIFDADKSQSIAMKTRIAAADALARAGDPRFLPSVRQNNWVTIPTGPFVMKSTGNQVQLDEFRVARYPVTVGEYADFVEEGGYQDQRWWSDGGFGDFTEPDNWDDQQQNPTRPVTDVSWFEATAYAAWFSNHLPPQMQCRLLTEAEWERAAGGVEGREYPWGNDQADESRLNFDGKVGHVTPVGLYPRGMTPDEIHEMAGNVWEWTATEEASLRVLRGGGWSISAGTAGVARRYGNEPVNRRDSLGFRLALVPVSSSKQVAEHDT